MPLTDYLTGLRRFWYALLACLLVGLVAAAAFLQLTLLDQASGSVTVLDPLSTHGAGYLGAQITFDSIVRSQQLADQVAAVVNENPGVVRGNLSVTAATTLNVSNPSLLYVVHGRDRGMQRATLLVNTAIDLGIKLYSKLNAADGSALRASIATENKVANDDLAAAQAALLDFEAANNAGSLQARLQAATDAGERSRLEHLIVQYRGLQNNVSAGQARVNQIAIQEETLVLDQLVPTEGIIKVLDRAGPEGQSFYKALIYFLGGATGLALGLLGVYTLTMARAKPISAADVGAAMAAPVLIRIPRAS